MSTPSDARSHALGDPVKVKTFYDDLIAKGRDLGVSMLAWRAIARPSRGWRPKRRPHPLFWFRAPLCRLPEPLLQNGCATDLVEFLTKLPYSFRTPPTLAELARR